MWGIFSNPAEQKFIGYMMIENRREKNISPKSAKKV